MLLEIKGKIHSAEGSIHQEGIAIINIYAPNNKTPKIHEAKPHRIKVSQLNSHSWILQ